MPKEIEAPESGQWKDYLNRDRMEQIAGVFTEVFSEESAKASRSFKREAFVDAVCTDEFFALELKDRIAYVARVLRDFLPAQYDKAVKILVKAAPTMGGWGNWALTSYVEQFGIEHFETSVNALRELTKYGSSEFAIRPYMIRYLDRMMPILHEWAEDDNEHVRRLAAEGSRPRGVWVAHIEQFRKDPKPVLELLEKMKADQSLYVRKAVANNLNDISKDHPKLVIKTGLKWMKSGNKETAWIVKHACRSLIKQGYPEVFPLFGFTADPQVKVLSFGIADKKVTIGDESTVSVELASTGKKKQKLAIDYAVHYLKKNGKHNAKVFKLTERSLGAGESLSFSTKHSFREMTTRRHYPGLHKLDLIINGTAMKTVEFQVVSAKPAGKSSGKPSGKQASKKR